MEKILEILQDIRSDVNYEQEERLVSDGILDSVGITVLIAELEEQFDIEIGMEYMDNKNFDSARAIYKMVQELGGDKN